MRRLRTAARRAEIAVTLVLFVVLLPAVALLAALATWTSPMDVARACVDGLDETVRRHWQAAEEDEEYLAAAEAQAWTDLLDDAKRKRGG